MALASRSKMVPGVLTSLLIGIVALALPLASNAQLLQISITDNLGHGTLIVNDNGPGDSNPAPNAITVETALLNTPAELDRRKSGTLISG